MSNASQQVIEAIRAYGQLHPEVDWDLYMVKLARCDGGYHATGHVLRNLELEARLNACCMPDCPTHGSERPECSG